MGSPLDESTYVTWGIEVTGFSLSKKNLEDLLQNLGFYLIEHSSCPCFSSREINACKTATDAFGIANHVKSTFVEVTRLDLEFTFGDVIDFSKNPPLHHSSLGVLPVHSTTVVGSAAISSAPPDGLSAARLEHLKTENEAIQYDAKLESQLAWLEPAFNCPTAAKVIGWLSSNDLSAETLYKIYEIIRGKENIPDFHARYQVSPDDFNRFRDAVHNPTVNGDWARHALGEKPRTKNPMTPSEAEEFIRRIAGKWLKVLRTSLSETQKSRRSGPQGLRTG